MTSPNLGNQLNQLVADARGALFAQGELAQLAYSAFDVAANNIQQSTEEKITIQFPIGYNADRTPLLSSREYEKDELVNRYGYLAFHQLSVNGIVQLVTVMEALLGDLTRAIVIRYPQKLSAKRSIKLQQVLEATTLEEVHFRATDALLNELAYKSPKEFADAFAELASVNLLECPAYHRYAEVKATRDIHIHNRGIANDVYEAKSGSHARVKSGSHLPVDSGYFLEGYEACIQVTEWLEAQLHDKWHSSELEERNRHQLEMKLGDASA